MRVVRALGGICRDLRLQVNVEADLPENDYQAVTSLMPFGAGRDWRTLKNFEEGLSNPTHLDDVILGYSRASGVPIGDIWRTAIAQAEASPNSREGQGRGQTFIRKDS